MGLSALLGFMALWIAAPLGVSATQAFTRRAVNMQVERAPWYFAGVQEMVSYSAFSGALLFPFFVLLALVIAPLLARDVLLIASVQRKAWRLDLLAFVWGLLAGLAGLFFWLRWGRAKSPLDPAQLVMLAALILAAISGWLARSWARFGRLLLLSLLAAYLLFTVVALFFRGPGWILIAPWAGGGGV